MNCGNFGTWLILYWWFLGVGQLNSKTQLWNVCLDGGYHLEKQVGFAYCSWGQHFFRWGFLPLRKLSMRFICENMHILFTAIWKYILSLSHPLLWLWFRNWNKYKRANLALIWIMEVMRRGFRSLIFQEGSIRSVWQKRLASKSDINSSHARISRIAGYISTTNHVL